MSAYELNLDGLVGPSHHYGGLGIGNLASAKNRAQVSSPKAAALQGLAKMKLVADLGIKQAVLPPPMRPDFSCLHELGFTGTETEVINKVAAKDLQLLSLVYSAASMWTANAATVSPAIDCADNKVNITTANLIANPHRSIESDSTHNLLQQIFADNKYFNVHPPLQGGMDFSDEGAANHNRICKNHAEDGLEFFVYGFDPETELRPTKFPARQSLWASLTNCKRHQLKQVIIAQQNPAVIDQGVFHNDVIATVNENVFLYHEQAFLDTAELLAKIKTKISYPMHFIEVKQSDISVADAVASYLFNGQILSCQDGMHWLLPVEVEQDPRQAEYVEQIIAADNPIVKAHYVDCKQSMRNGGGPACLRLRVVLTEAELAAMHQPVLFTNALYEGLVAWVQRHYRDKLALDDLRDPQLVVEIAAAMTELYEMLGLSAA